MNSLTATQTHDVRSSEFSSQKFPIDVVNPNLDLPAPPRVAVRARSTTEGIEMNVLGRSRNEDAFPGDNSSTFSESDESSRKEWAAVTACGLCLFLSGWHDGSIGPLIPTVQKYYDLTFTVVSILFVSECLGFMLSAILNVHLSDRLGFGRVIFLGGICQALSYLMLVPALPFPVMCVAFVINGFGIGLQDAQANGFVSALRNNPSAKMGIIHSLYGAGAFFAPFVATQFANQPHWSYLYMVPLIIASLNLVFLFSTFGFHTQEELLGPIQPADPIESGSNELKYKQVFGSWAVHVMAAFCLLYVGAETTMGGWVVTFFVEERGGGTSAGYISSGFFGGLMLGRIGLIWLNEKVGERRVVYAYVLLAIGLEMTVWMLPHLLGNAIAFALVGVLMGPMYPIGMNVLRTVVPKWLLTGSMGWVASVGQAGAALFPFLTGILIQKYGVGVLQPILVVLLGGMTISWALVPSNIKRRGD
ncbi:MFS general substrate transporter [Rhizoctonia solani]|nr:MFS general substrate transporter [Rhizoctonia solani]